MKKYSQYIYTKKPTINDEEYEKLMQELYIQESNREDRPLFYQNEIYNNCIELFDKLIIKLLSKNTKSFIFCKTAKKKNELKSQYKGFNIINIDDVYATYKRRKITNEYIKISNYYNSLFRMIYRHLYNDKENFEIIKDNLKNGYIMFNISSHDTKKYHFRSKLVKQDSIKDSNAILSAIKDSIKELNDDKLRVDRIHPKVFYEKLIYATFIGGLEGHILIHILKNNINKITIAKNKNKNNSKIKNTDNVIYIEDICLSIIEELRRTVYNTYLNPEDAKKELQSFDTKKYIYPCWVMACDHFANNGLNYHIIDGDRYDEYMHIRIFI